LGYTLESVTKQAELFISSASIFFSSILLPQSKKARLWLKFFLALRSGLQLIFL
jgi:hypothetical protein